MTTTQMLWEFSLGRVSEIPYKVSGDLQKRRRDTPFDSGPYCEHSGIAAIGGVVPLAGPMYRDRRAVFIIGRAYCPDCKGYWERHLPSSLLGHIYKGFEISSRPPPEPTEEERALFDMPALKID